MQPCPACGHALAGIAGVPDGPGAPFSADVRCPECAHLLARGTCVLVGARASQPFARRSRWLPRWAALLLSNDASAFLLTGAFGLAGLLLVGSFAIDVVRGVRPGLDLWHLGIGAVAALAFLVAANGLRLRIRAEVTGDGQPPRPWRVLEASPLGVRWSDDAPPPRAIHDVGEDRADAPASSGGIAVRFGEAPAERVRTVRIVELFPSGNGMLVQAIAYLRTDRGGSGQSDAIYLVLPTGAAARTAAAMMAVIRERAEDADARVRVGGDGILVLEGSTRRPRRGPETSTRAIGCLIGVAGATILFSFFQICFGLAFGSILLAIAFAHVYGTPRIDHAVWRIAPGEIRREGRRSLSADAIACIEVEVERGVPVLRFVRKGAWIRRRLRFIPDDWQGLEPASFARAVEALLRRADPDPRR